LFRGFLEADFRTTNQRAANAHGYDVAEYAGVPSRSPRNDAGARRFILMS
jgi:hypothetical protein